MAQQRIAPFFPPEVAQEAGREDGSKLCEVGRPGGLQH